MKGHQDSINILILDNKFLFSASDDKTIKIWETDTQTMVHSLELHKERVNTMVLEDGLLISTAIDSSVVVYNYPTDKVLHRFKKKVSHRILRLLFPKFLIT
jgi:WD40 repeat protein